MKITSTWQITSSPRSQVQPGNEITEAPPLALGATKHLPYPTQQQDVPVNYRITDLAATLHHPN